MTLPLVTIGLTTYNAENTVSRALQSALAQTWRPIEILVVDDCSTDQTTEIIFELAGQCSEIRVLVNERNRGVAVSRNRILTEARGEFVAFFDDDDVSATDRVAEQYRRIVDYENTFAEGAPVICHTARKLIYLDGEERIEPTAGQDLCKRAPAGEAMARWILMGAALEGGYGACPTCSQMGRLSTYGLVGGFDPEFRRSEDTDFIIRLAQAGGHFVGVEAPLVTQIMTKTPEKNLAEEYRNWTSLIEKHRAFMEAEGQYDFCRRWLHVKQLYLEGRRGAFGVALLMLACRYPGLTTRRLLLAFPNRSLNLSFSRFHGGNQA